MNVIFTESALDEIEDILRFIARDNESAAVSVVITIEAAAARLSRFPFLGTQTDEADVRMMLARPYPYRIFYQVEPNQIIIRNVIHCARDH